MQLGKILKYSFYLHTKNIKIIFFNHFFPSNNCLETKKKLYKSLHIYQLSDKIPNKLLNLNCDTKKVLNTNTDFWRLHRTVFTALFENKVRAQKPPSLFYRKAENKVLMAIKHFFIGFLYQKTFLLNWLVNCWTVSLPLKVKPKFHNFLSSIFCFHHLLPRLLLYTKLSQKLTIPLFYQMMTTVKKIWR